MSYPENKHKQSKKRISMLNKRDATGYLGERAPADVYSGHWVLVSPQLTSPWTLRIPSMISDVKGVLLKPSLGMRSNLMQRIKLHYVESAF